MRTETPADISSDVAFSPRDASSRGGNALESRLSSGPRLDTFEELMLPHLDAAFNLARWMTQNDDDARDVVQEAYLRAFRFFDTFRGGDGKPWLLEVVRNTCRTWQRRRNRDIAATPFDEVEHSVAAVEPSQEDAAAGQEKTAVLRHCIEILPEEFREVLVLRELEEMSYREIAGATGLALGTIMSRLSRARKRLTDCAGRRGKEARR